MKSKLILFIALTSSLAVLSGCTSLKGNVPFQYQPSLISSTKKVNKSVGFNIIKDGRPEKEIKSTEKTIKDVPNKVTYKMMEDFKSSGIFSEVNFPPKESDDIVINGTLHRFNWKINTNWIAIITYLMYFGLPIEEHIGEVDISLEVIENKTGKVLGNVQGNDLEKLKYSLYNISIGEPGSELAEAFRESVKELKEKMLSEINF